MTTTNRLIRPLPDVPRWPSEHSHIYRRQVRLLQYVARFRDRFGYPPTIREIQAHLGFRHPSAILTALHHLRDKGIITWDARHSRTLRIIYHRKETYHGQSNSQVHPGPSHRPSARSTPSHPLPRNPLSSDLTKGDVT